MPKLYNHDRLPVTPRPHSRAVEYGETADFSDEEVANGIGGNWSPESPFPKYVKKHPQPEVKAEVKPDPATPENDEEEK